MGRIIHKGVDYSAPSSGGNGESAKKLCSSTGVALSVGSAIRPVYFNNGVPVAGTYTLEKSVPANAVFTNSKVSQVLLFSGSKTIAAGQSDSISVSGYILDRFDITIITTNFGTIIFYKSDIRNAIFAQNASNDYMAYITVHISYNQEDGRIYFSNCYECYYEDGYGCSMRLLPITITNIISVKLQDEE